MTSCTVCDVNASTTTPADLTDILNRDLDIIEKWIFEDKLILNISETKSLVFGSNHSLRREPELKLLMNKNTHTANQENQVIGHHLDNKLSWSKHRDTIV